MGNNGGGLRKRGRRGGHERKRTWGRERESRREDAGTYISAIVTKYSSITSYSGSQLVRTKEPGYKASTVVAMVKCGTQ